MTSGKLTFAIGGMRCPDCVTAIENAVMPLPGVLYAGASLAGATLTVRPGPGFSKQTWSLGSWPWDTLWGTRRMRSHLRLDLAPVGGRFRDERGSADASADLEPVSKDIVAPQAAHHFGHRRYETCRPGNMHGPVAQLGDAGSDQGLGRRILVHGPRHD